MRTLPTLALAAALSFMLVSTAAGQEPITGTTIIVPGQAPRNKLDSEQFKDFKGSYLLSNGKTLKVMNRGKRYFAEIDGEPSVEIVPAGTNTFVARDSDMMYLFDQMYNGRKTDVIIKPRAAKIG